MQARNNIAPAVRFTPKEIQALFKEKLEAVETSIKDNCQSSVAMIPMIGEYLAAGGGKRLRPMLVLATSSLCGYKGGNKDVIHSTVIEYIHAATLLHDDVVDDADIRRGIPSVNVKFGNEYSVLTGDFLFARSFSMMSVNSTPEMIQALSDATANLAEGEILELVHNADMELTEEKYIDLVYRKTGALIQASCVIGAHIGCADKEKLKALKNYGENIGIAFQIVDDMLDFTASKEKLGKPVGQDLVEGHITLPIIHACSQASEDEKRFLTETVNDEKLTKQNIGEILAVVKKYESIDYCQRIAEKYVEEAVASLDCFEPDKYLDALKGLAEYIVNRDT